MNVEYRNYKDQDYSDFCKMVFCLYEEDPEGLAISEIKIQRTISESVAHPEKLQIIIICENELIIGYAILVFFWSNEHGSDILHIDELYVKEQYRNKGVASEFIKYQRQANKNIAAIELEATPSNNAAENLYNKLGFEKTMNSHMILYL